MTYGLIPVVIHYENDEGPAPQNYAKGGLVVKAKAVRNAGRYGDTELIHVNKEELDELRLRWGEPTINPETGMPEFFLGKIGKILGKVAKIAAPIAVSFIPGIGPIASAALGAAVGGGLGALGGGGLKGALTGAVTGGLGAFGGNALGAGKVFASGAKALTPALQTGASSVGAGISKAATTAANLATPVAQTTTSAITPALVKAAAMGGADVAGAVAPTATTAADTVAAAAKPNFWNQQFLGLPIKNKLAIPLGVGALALSGAFKGSKEDPIQTPDQFFQPQLGGKGFGQTPGGSNITGINTARTANQRPLDDYSRAGYMPEFKYFSAEGGEVDRHNDNWRPTGRVNASTRGGSDYGVDIPIGRGALSLDALGGGMRPERLSVGATHPVGRGRLDIGAEADHGVKPNRFRAKLTVPFEGGGGVGGEGSGRDDKIEARLSDGEYVMDAETVAMLGDGSTKAGAKALDDFRIKIRKHKGAKLAKGAISAKAKAPHRYLAGGRG